ncbi:TraR/DksA family transcriptional regulator [Limnohabitans sp. TS-CS-82]|jgi:DnaK suppressor protein|uniref:TraR/DksA family transcriptional regulator n=1 Tax=Limnohabitans sp. TS-CS-82 TaxID=2094193 RepID=UPI001F2FF683|nr:TraR/DksA family transcriptional regulator [Limnohabitans sp. TS-CS-82]
MDQTETTRIKRMLETLRANVLARIAEQRGGLHSRAEVAAEQFAPTQDSHAQTITEHDIALALSEHETQELTHIDDALQRLAAGTYGLCTTCGQAIATARLKAWPDVARCIGCQEKAEHIHP